MNSRVLFSAVGSTDPIRDNYDGPMLHIVRHFQPRKVILFLSKEMGEREKKNHLYSQAIKSVDAGIEIEPIYSEITDVSDFEQFTNIIPMHLNSIGEKYSGEEVLVNISSGTLQMISAINLYTVSSQYVFKSIQVTTPKKGPNDSPVVTDEFDSSVEIPNNLDAEVSFHTENRTRMVNLDGYRKNMVIVQIKRLLDVFNYDACDTLLESEKIEISSVSMQLIQHARRRFRFQFPEANKILGNNFDDFKIRDGENRDLIEYFNILLVHYNNKNVDYFLVMLINIGEYLMGSYLKVMHQVDFESVTIRKKKNNSKAVDEYISEDKFKERFPNYYDLKYFSNKKLTKEFYLKYDLIMKLSDGKQPEMVQFFEEVKSLKEKRNNIAHELMVTSDPDNLVREGILEVIDKYLRKYHIKGQENQIGIYGRLNEAIITHLG